MTSRTNPRFRAAFRHLPVDVQNQARRAFRLFKLDPWHSGVQFKRVHGTEDVYSARIGLSYRALDRRKGDTITWFWIGPHAEYDRLIST